MVRMPPGIRRCSSGLSKILDTSDSNLTGSSPPIQKRPNGKVAPKRPIEIEGNRPNETVEADNVVHKRRRASYWEYRDNSSGLLWANTTRRPTEASSPAHELVLREAKQVLVARIFSGQGPQLSDGRMCWPETHPSALSKLMEMVWVDTARKLGVEIGIGEGSVLRKPRNFEARKVSRAE